jgi:LysR family transcriptional regulator of abg operon
MRYHCEMKIHQLQCMVTVAEKGSVRAASGELNVSPAAVSQALRELERTVGATLLTRQAQGITLTFLGRQLLIHARLIVGQVARAGDEISQLQGESGGTVSIGVTPWVMQSILPVAIRVFRLARPDVRLDIAEALGTAHPELRDGGMDLVIGLAPPRQQSSGFSSQHLFVCPMAIIARRGHPLAGCQSLAELAGLEWVRTMRQDVEERSMNELMTPFDAAPQVEKVHFARSTLSALGMLECTDMLAIVPWPLVESSLLRGRFEALPIRELMPDMKTSLVVRRDDTLAAPARMFIDCLHKTVDSCMHSEDPVLRRVLGSVELACA